MHEGCWIKLSKHRKSNPGFGVGDVLTIHFRCRKIPVGGYSGSFSIAWLFRSSRIDFHGQRAALDSLTWTLTDLDAPYGGYHRGGCWAAAAARPEWGNGAILPPSSVAERSCHAKDLREDRLRDIFLAFEVEELHGFDDMDLRSYFRNRSGGDVQ